MNPGLIVKLRPTGPWRSGPDSGARNQVDPIYHSDSLYAAVTSAMIGLGQLEEWLDATARNPAGPAVCFSSCFPFQEDVGYIVPPRNLWPPAGLSAKVRWKGARFIPVGLVEALIAGQVLDEERWVVDGPSECLAPEGRPGPFRTAVRTNAAVDRLTGCVDRHATACIDFLPGAGLWTVVSFANEERQARWSGPVRAAFRLLADSGFGGERSRGWGRAEEPEFVEGSLPNLIVQPQENPLPETAHWLLSLFIPGPGDQVDWQRGNYAVVQRGGRVESPLRSGDLKKLVSMVTEGSVLYGGEVLQGTAPDVAPDGFAHPVFRAGFALSIPLPIAAASS